MASRTGLPSPTGYTSDEVIYKSIWADAQELVPELVWPESNRTYSLMRRDAHLAAILTAYCLPIRRATWQVNPAGCRPEVVQVVADDLGLPIAGNDEPTAARVRGVSWPDHLRTALLHVVYGHMAFELGAEVNAAGQARLTTLAERMPHTIVNIEVERDGSLLAIEQFAVPGMETHPMITADRLLWYAHDREGAAWQGSSLLRPAYAPWLLKREMLRVAATSNRRFGMGVPTVVWDTNITNLTPAQYEAGQAAASAARVGDQAGLTLPPGARLELIGLSGSVPDTVGFMRFLDQQMSKMALTGFLDLSESTHGSRALGREFVDLLFLGIQAIGEYAADAITRQVAARLVAWNWGPDEPVPAVTVGDVGASHEVTAESLGHLLQSGALQADPALDAYVRKEYSLPERVTPWVQPQPRGIGAGSAPAITAAPDQPGTNPPADRQADLDWGLYGGSN